MYLVAKRQPSASRHQLYTKNQLSVTIPSTFEQSIEANMLTDKLFLQAYVVNEQGEEIAITHAMIQHSLQQLKKAC